ncbi:hypothetical protein ACSBR2_031060 [Camellia fascicularis]
MLLEKNLPSKVLHIVSIGWKSSWEDRFKLNIDGVSKASPNRAGRCGIIRDSLGMWVAGFMRNIDTALALEAELCALRDGLMLRYLMKRLRISTVDHILREAKKCADILANQGGYTIDSFVVFDFASPCLSKQLHDDGVGILYLGTVSVTLS